MSSHCLATPNNNCTTTIQLYTPQLFPTITAHNSNNNSTNSIQLYTVQNSTQHTHTRVAHPCVFAPDTTHPAQSPLTQMGHVARPLGASAQAAKECLYGCQPTGWVVSSAILYRTRSR